MGLQQWFNWNIQYCTQVISNTSWNTLFVTMCWWSWKWRNIIAFDKEDVHHDKAGFVRKQAIEFERAWMVGRNLNGYQQETRRDNQRWTPPREGYFKLNIDGCSKGNPGKAGGGGLIRNEAGNWCVGFVYNLGCCNAIWAEVGTLRQGLLLAKERGYKPLQVETDSSLTVRYLTEGVDLGNPIAPLVNSCKNLISSIGQAEVGFCVRECNSAADWLANHALIYPRGIHVLESPPESCKSVLETDKSS